MDTTLVPATSLTAGMHLTNVGTVQGPPSFVGVFVLIPVEAHEWSIGTGRLHDTVRTVVLHCTDDAAVDVDSLPAR